MGIHGQGKAINEHVRGRSGAGLHSPATNARIISNKRINGDCDPLLSNLQARYCSPNPLASHESGFSDEDLIIVKGDLPLSFSASEASRTDRVRSHYLAMSEYYPSVSGTTLSFSDLLPYYLPVFSWIGHYCTEYFIGDLVGGLSLATFQIPLAISYSHSLAKVSIKCGLYSLGIAPLIYMLLGSVPQMITGPEAPMSLIVGQAVEPLLHHSKKKKVTATDYVVAITFLSGATLLGFGLGRFGFLDNVLCESLLKGFICGVGAVMVINALIPLLGLEDELKAVIGDKLDMDIHSPFDKLRFAVTHLKKSHLLSLQISACAFIAIISFRYLKGVAMRSKSRRLKNAVYFPEILVVVAASTIFCLRLNWSNQGVAIIGDISETSNSVPLMNPLSAKHLKLMKTLSSSAFVCAMLGFFESTTALKSLGSQFDLPISSNRELVALGAINIVCSIFGGLPAFGGYGRSKINAISARTTFSGAIMGVLSLFTAQFVLQYLKYVPKCILSVITASIGILLMSEGPAEVKFHWQLRGLNELITFFITILTTLFFSMEAGIAVGLIYLLIRVIKNSAESNIQILGRVPGTNTFLDADLANACHHLEAEEMGLTRPPAFEKRHSQLNLFTDTFRPLNFQALEEIEGCLIIKIPEPLTFTNASDLRARLKRVEMYGSTRAHPALKRSRDSSMSKYMIFDLEGMSFIDSSAAQILSNSIKGYNSRGIRTFFIRVSKSVKLRLRLQSSGIKDVLSNDLTAMLHHRLLSGAFASSEPPNYGSSPSQNNSLIFEAPTESRKLPYFNHIRDALSVIDEFEQNQTELSQTIP